MFIKNNKYSEFFISCLSIIAVGFLCLGLLPFTQYCLYDSIWTSYFLKSPGQLWCLERILNDIGRPLDFFFFYPLHFVGNPVAWSKVISVIAWISAALCFQSFLHEGLRLSRIDSAFCAVLALAIPLFDLLGELCVLMNAVASFFFWAGWLLLVNLRSTRYGGPRRWFARVVALAFFALSFNLNSQLVLFYGVAFCVVCCSAECASMKGLALSAARELKSFPDFFLLPIAFWVWKSVFCPLGGVYVEWKYNEITLSPTAVSAGAFSLANTLLSEIQEAMHPPWRLFFALGAAAFVAVVVRLKPRWSGPSPLPPAKCLFYVALGGLMLASAVFPYAVTKKLFDASGWDSRNTVLLHFPLAIILFFSMKLLQGVFAPKHARSLYSLTAIVVAAGIISWNASILRLEALGAKQRSVSSKIREGLLTRSPHAISLRDYFQIPKTIDFYPHIMWTYMITEINEFPRVLVVDTRPFAPDQLNHAPDGKINTTIPIIKFDSQSFSELVRLTTQDYALSSIPREGDTQTVIITPGKYGDQGVEIGINSLIKKYLNTYNLKSFYQDLSMVRFIDDKGLQQIY